jgi:predicted Zn-dependent peptidase
MQGILSISSLIPRSSIGNIHIQALTESVLSDILFKKIRLEHSWCYSIDADLDEIPDFAESSISTHVDPNHIEETESLIWEVIEDIKTGKYEESFNSQKELLRDRLRSKEITTLGVMNNASNSYRIHGKISTFTETFNLLQEVTFKDVVELVKLAFDRERVHTEIIHMNEPEILIQEIEVA